jgi:hypothetical protein
MRIDLHNILRVLMLASTLLAGLWLLDSAWPLLSRRVGPEQVSTVTASVEWPSPILFQPDDWQSVRRRELIPVGASGRLAAILLAMQPDFDDDGDVAGYQLELLGEDILYEAAGMLEGDIVRAVNSMPMTSPARAQYFISEFLQGNISAIVLDVEREGVESKLIYLIR